MSFAARQWLDMFSPSNLPWTNPEVAQETFRTGGQNLVAGFANWSEDQAPRALAKQPPVGAETFAVGKHSRDDARQGHLSQPSDRADPVRTRHRDGASRTGADRAGLDHEILHPRSFAAQLAGPLPGRAGLHGVLHLLAQPRTRTTATLASTTIGGSASWRRWTPSRRSCRTRRSMPPAIASAARCCRSPRRPWRATATTRLASRHAVRGADRLHRAGELQLFIDDSQVYFLEDMMW